MEWTKLDLGGRVTAMSGASAGGVTSDGTAFVARLGSREPERTTFGDRFTVDSMGVVGLANGAGGNRETFLTARGADGRLHLWGVREGCSTEADSVRELGFGDLEIVWSAPVVDTEVATAFTAGYARHGGWTLQAHWLSPVGGGPRGRPLRLGGPPDTTVSYAVHARDHLIVVGVVGDGDPGAAAWVLDTSGFGASRGVPSDWRRVALSPLPDALSSVAVCGGDTLLAGAAEGRPVVYRVSALAFRGPVRSSVLPAPSTELDPAAVRPVVLVDGAERALPMLLTSSVVGNTLWWRHAGSWHRLVAPPGQLRRASLAGGCVRVLVDHALWSLPDPVAAP